MTGKTYVTKAPRKRNKQRRKQWNTKDKKIIAAAASKSLKMIQKRTETKYHDATDQSHSVSTAGSVINLSDVPASNPSTDTSRDGDQITIMSCQVKLTSSNDDSFNYIRVIIFQWNELKALPAASDILPYWNTRRGILSPYRHDTKPLYRILCDKIVATDSDDPSGYFNVMLTRNMRRQVQFNKPGATAFNNGLYMLMISDSDGLTHPQVDYVSRVRFKDN